MRSLFAPRPSPYYIFGFNYRRSSAGIRVMHMLCDALIRSGHEAYVHAEAFSPDLMTPQLTDKVIAQHRSLGIKPVVIYPEVIDGNPLHGEIVVRYLLNKPGFISGKGEYADSDLLFAYKDDFRTPAVPAGNNLFLPAINSEIFRPAADAQRRVPGKVCYYLGHKRQAQLDPALLPADAVEITLAYPDTWEGLAAVFQECEYLYLGEASGLAYEAALCGCLPVVVSMDWSSITVDRTSFTAFGLEPEELARARACLPQVREVLELERRTFWTQLDHFIAVTQQAAVDVRAQAAIHQPLALASAGEGAEEASEVDATQVGVVLHVEDTTFLADAISRLQGLQRPLRVYVSTPARQAKQVTAALEASGLSYLLFNSSAVGDHVLPFLELLPLLQKDGIEVLLKLHTHHAGNLDSKVSSDLVSHLLSLLVNERTYDEAVRELAEGERRQLIGPGEYQLPVAQFSHGQRQAHLELLAKRAGLDLQVLVQGEFFIGGMFFARLDAMLELLELKLAAPDFIADPGLAGSFELFVNGFVQARHPLDRNLVYRDWLASRQLSHNEVRHLEARVASWSVQPSFLLVLTDLHGDAAAVARSLDAIDQQIYAAGAVLVLSNAEPVGIQARDNLVWLPLDRDWAGQLNDVLQQIEVDWFQLLRAGDVLDQHALLLLAERINNRPAMRSCYVDEDGISNGRCHDPVFKPDLNLDMLRSYPYVGRALLFQREAMLELGGFDPLMGELAPHDLLFRVIEHYGIGTVEHLAEVLVHQQEHLGTWLAEAGVVQHVATVVSDHLQRLNLPHRIEPGVLPMINRVRYCFDGQPLVSIIIPTKDQLPVLLRCVDSLLERTQYPNYEVLVVDNNSETPEALEWFEGVERMDSSKLRVLRYPHPFNYSAINNFAATFARGEYLVLLNNDTGITDGGWLDALLNHARRPEVGIVGAKLHHMDGSIQHAGVLLGLRGVAEHNFIGDPINSNGYMHRLQVDQNYSAVTAACLMIRKSVYEEVGGFDEDAFRVSYNDVDLCLKVNQAGYLTVWTPYAALMHEGSVSQRSVDQATFEAKLNRFQGEQRALYKKWLPNMVREPAYNKNLALEGRGFALEHRTEIGWQPFEERSLPYVLLYPADAFGCGHYRVRQPFQAAQDEGLIDGAVSERLLPLVELERLAPQTVVFQRQVTPQQLQVMNDVASFSQAFKVYELDDYLFELPSKSVHRNTMPGNIADSLRKALGFCDRFVVSTEPLAEAFAGLHADIRVVPNRLPPSWWQGLSSQRRAGRKPRVGWAGGSSHTGDLEMLLEVVPALAKEVEWVFLGMCPEALRPYVEFHRGVSIDRYPAKLASLNLDLAIAPLEENRFNECKSNLRLLEYGALGWPVVCSDILCYRGDLPVTRVKNQASAWIEAIRMHLADLDATQEAGDRLREAVLGDWMLQGEHLVEWRKAWLA